MPPFQIPSYHCGGESNRHRYRPLQAGTGSHERPARPPTDATGPSDEADRWPERQPLPRGEIVNASALQVSSTTPFVNGRRPDAKVQTNLGIPPPANNLCRGQAFPLQAFSGLFKDVAGRMLGCANSAKFGLPAQRPVATGYASGAATPATELFGKRPTVPDTVRFQAFARPEE